MGLADKLIKRLESLRARKTPDDNEYHEAAREAEKEEIMFLEKILKEDCDELRTALNKCYPE